MSVEHHAATIIQRFDYSTADAYLLKHGVLTVGEFDSFRKALQNGSSTNTDLVRRLFPKISEKPREFYRALRESVSDQSQNVHPGNKELFHHLPKNFVSFVLVILY